MPKQNTLKGLFVGFVVCSLVVGSISLFSTSGLVALADEAVETVSEQAVEPAPEPAPAQEPEPTVVEQTQTTETLVSEETVSSEEVVSTQEPQVVEETQPLETSTPVEEQSSEATVEQTFETEPVQTEETVVPQILGSTDENTISSSDSIQSPELSTDKPDYHLYETVNIFGRFFGALQQIALRIFGGSVEEGTYTESTQEVTADESGSFSTTYQLDLIYRPLYTVVANAVSSGAELARTTFTDAPPSIDLEQCRNGAAGSPNNCADLGGGSGWVTGNVGASQGHLAEGMSIPYRTVFKNLPVGPAITLTLGYDIKHSGKHAIDYLTHYSRLEPHAIFGHLVETVSPTDGVTGISGPTTTFPIPVPSSSSSPTVGQPSDSFNALPSGERVMTLFGGTITGLSYSTQGDLNAAQDETRITVTFVASSSDAVLSWGGHIASAQDWGAGNSAGGISGSPYHMRLISWNLGNLGNTDRSLSAAVIVTPPATGAISGVKFEDINGDSVKDPSDSPLSGWTITLSGTAASTTVTAGDGTYSFTGLADGTYDVCETLQAGWTQTFPTSGTACPGSTLGYTVVISGGSASTGNDFGNSEKGTIIVEKQTNPDGAAGSFTFTGTAAGTISDGGQITVTDLAPGSYTSTEADPSPTFALGTIVCSDSNSTGNVGTRTATFNLESGETVTCVFTNNLQTGHIIVDKVTLPASDPESFTFVTTGSGYSGFSLTDAAAPNDQTLVAGSYSVSETVPAGWDLTNTNCVSSLSDTETAGSLELDAGETITCTFTNTKKGHIIVNKVTVGGDDTFNFDASGAGYNDFSLSNGGSNNQGVVPGAYSVSETVPAGWSSDGGVCDQGETPASLDVGAGEIVTCTFTNTKLATAVVKKVMVGGTDTFSYTGTPNGSISTNNGTIQATNLTPGVYVSTETVPAGWDLTSIVCDDGNSTGNTGTGAATFNLEAGETVTCTFTNTKKGTIVIKKVVDPSSDTTEFNFAGDVSGLLGHNETASAQVTPGTYSSTETVPAGWDLTSIVCDDGNSTGNIGTGVATFNVAAGETVTCTFTDQKDSNIIVIKQTDPDGDPTSFEFDPSYAANFFLTDGNSNDSGDLDPNTYSVSEIVPAGWDLTSATCDDGSDPSSISLSAGETVTCTFNDQADAIIIVEKQTLPDGSLTVFDFDLSYGSGDADLSDGQTDNSGDLNPGTYSVSENTPAGWDLTSAICNDGSNATSISLTAGETVTCVFTNTQRGHVIIQKNAINDSSQVFTFHNNFGNGNATTTTLVDDSTPGFATSGFEVLPGTYSVSEDPVADWQSPESTSCDSGETVDSIDVGPGETVTCTFVNEELATIILVKNTIGGNETFDFVMTGAGLPAGTQLTTVAGTDSETFNDLDPDNTYTITETPIPAGWALTGATCTGSNATSSITPNAGEIITCTFTNNKPDAQIDLTPLTDTNKVGEDHVITVNVQVHNGDGVWGPAPDGTLVTFSITNSNGATASFVGSDNDCTTTGGSCSVAINSPTAGNVSVHASAGPVVLGVTVNVATGTGGENSADAQKDYVNARISITPDQDTNEVNDDHSFTVTVEQSVANGVWTPVPAGTLANAIVSPATTLDVSDCNDGVNASGQCNVIVNSSAAGVFTITARSTVVVNGVTFKLQTNGVGQNSGPAVKTYVDANISLDPLDETNQVNEPHTVTVTVLKNPGSGFVAAAGEHVDFTLTPSGATPVLNATASTCDDAGANTDGSGQCVIVFTSATPGTVTIHASVDLIVGGVALHRETGDGLVGDSADANKKYEAGRIIVQKVTIGGDASFNFNADYQNDFQLSNGQSNDSGYIPTGAHSVTEDPIVGWDLTNVTCNSSLGGTENNTAINLTDGEIVTCTFENTKRATITIVKDAEPQDCQDFTFARSFGANFLLDDDNGVQDCTDANQPQSITFQNVVPGDVTVTETVPNQFWKLDNASCVVTGTSNSYSSSLNGTTLSLNLAPGVDVTCTFQNDKITPTRTLGFWQTHLTYTTSIFNAPPNTFSWFSAGNMTVGDGILNQNPVNTIGKIFGGFWSSISKLSNGKTPRNALDKARMQLAQQLIAAKLNCAAFGCPASIQTLIATADTNYAGTSISAILASAAALDAYNNSGDTIIVGPTGKADPKAAKSAADYLFWDNP